MQIEGEMCLATKDRINPCWGRSLLLHSSVIAAVVMVSYGVYLALLLGGLLPRDKCMRVVCNVALVVWFLLTLWGLSCWASLETI